MSKNLENLRIAIVHDQLTQRGGAEVVLEEMLRTFPQAEVFTLFTAGKPEIIVDDKSYAVKTTLLQKLPLWFRRHPKRLLPFLPYAAEQLDLSNFDLVLSSSSAFAKAVVVRSHIPHVSYCHTPTRFLWDNNWDAVKQAPFGTRFLANIVFHFLRLSDFAAAQRITKFLANSEWTKKRINAHYRKDSEVVYPPIDTAFYYPQKTERKHFLVVGRLTPAKNFEQAIAVCAKLDLPLVVAGTGHNAGRLRKLAGGANVKFVGRVSDEELRDLYRSAFALLQPAEEDFGMTAAEALACGTPVIAYGVGGVAEIVKNNENGILYYQNRTEYLAEALRQFLSADTAFQVEELQQSVLRFSKQDFQNQLKTAVAQELEKRTLINDGISATNN